MREGVRRQRREVCPRASVSGQQGGQTRVYTQAGTDQGKVAGQARQAALDEGVVGPREGRKGRVEERRGEGVEEVQGGSPVRVGGLQLGEGPADGVIRLHFGGQGQGFNQSGYGQNR